MSEPSPTTTPARDPALDHRGAERAGVEVHEALVHHGRALGEVGAEAHAVGVGDPHAGRRDVVGHARELVDAVDRRATRRRRGSAAAPRAARRGRPGRGSSRRRWAARRRGPSRSAVGLHEAVREQVQAQVGVVGVGGRRLEVVDHGDDLDHGTPRRGSSCLTSPVGRPRASALRRAPSCGSRVQHVQHASPRGSASPGLCPRPRSSARHASSPRNTGTAQPVRSTCSALVDVDDQLAAVEMRR